MKKLFLVLFNLGNFEKCALVIFALHLNAAQIVLVSLEKRVK